MRQSGNHIETNYFFIYEMPRDFPVLDKVYLKSWLHIKSRVQRKTILYFGYPLSLVIILFIKCVSSNWFNNWKHLGVKYDVICLRCNSRLYDTVIYSFFFPEICVTNHYVAIIHETNTKWKYPSIIRHFTTGKKMC